MSKKAYTAPFAELILLAPSDEIAAASWTWGVFSGENASGTTKVNVEVWDPFDFKQTDDSYKISD